MEQNDNERGKDSEIAYPVDFGHKFEWFINLLQWQDSQLAKRNPLMILA